jgi:hypothetical protein
MRGECWFSTIDMADSLFHRIERIRAALGVTKSSDLSSLRASVAVRPGIRVLELNFNQGKSAAELANEAFGLVANIASIKDHLKNWCAINGKSFRGEELLNSSINAAVVHDLWNTDKHAELNRPPRSGFRPRIIGLRRVLRFSGGPQSSAELMVSTSTGRTTIDQSGGAGAELVLEAQIVDESGAVRGTS